MDQQDGTAARATKTPDPMLIMSQSGLFTKQHGQHGSHRKQDKKIRLPQNQRVTQQPDGTHRQMTASNTPGAWPAQKQDSAEQGS